jgi:fluoride ion exporter CrcB/FEX
VATAAAGAVTDVHVAAMGTGVAGGLTTFSTWVVHLVEPPDDASPGWDVRRMVRETLVGLLLAGAAVAATSLVVA